MSLDRNCPKQEYSPPSEEQEHEKVPGMVTRYLPEQLQSCCPPSLVVLLSILGDPDPGESQSSEPKCKVGSTVDLCGHSPSSSNMDLPQGTLDVCSSCSLSPSFLFKSMKDYLSGL